MHKNNYTRGLVQKWEAKSFIPKVLCQWTYSQTILHGKDDTTNQKNLGKFIAKI